MRAFSSASLAAREVAMVRSRSLTSAAKRLTLASTSSPRAILSMRASRSSTTAGSSTACEPRATAPARASAPTLMMTTLRIARQLHLVAHLHGAIHLGIGLLQLAQIFARRGPVAEHEVGLNEHRQRRLVDAATDGEAGVVEPLRFAILMRPLVLVGHVAQVPALLRRHRRQPLLDLLLALLCLVLLANDAVHHRLGPGEEARRGK